MEGRERKWERKKEVKAATDVLSLPLADFSASLRKREEGEKKLGRLSDIYGVSIGLHISSPD